MIKNGIVYICMLLAAFWVMIMYQEYYTLAAFIALAIMPFVFAIANAVASRFVKGYMKSQSVRSIVGNQLNISVIIENNSFVPMQKVMLVLMFMDSAGVKKTQKMYTNLGAREKKEIELHFGSETSTGGYVVLKSMRFYDIFGITSWRKKAEPDINTTFYGVYPIANQCNISVRVQNEIGLNENERYSTIKPGSDRSEVFGIREYIPGDLVKDVHWKLSSKKDELIVKEFSLPIDRGVKIILDTVVYRDSGNKYRLLSKYYEFARSICETLLQLSLTFSVILFNERAGVFNEYQINTADDVFMLVEMLLRQLPGEENKENKGYREKTFEVDEISGDIIYVSCGMDEKFIRYIKSLHTVENLYTVCIGKGEFYEDDARMVAESIGSYYFAVGMNENIANMPCIEI